MRYLMTTSSSRVSMWMSEARRLRASKIVESISRMMGDSSAWILSIEKALLAVLVLAQDLDLERLRGLLENTLGPLATLEGFLDGRRSAHRRLEGGLEDEAQLVDHRDVGGVGHDEHEPVPLPLVGQERVAEHQLDRHRLEDLRIRRRSSPRPRTRAPIARRAPAPPPPPIRRRGPLRRRRARPGHRSRGHLWTAEIAWNMGR